MKTDPAIETIRTIRYQISEEFDHDAKKLVRYYMELQKKHQDRLVKGSMHPPYESAA